MAAPNKARITARILRAEQSAQYPDKWILELEILVSEGLSGPNFAKAGEKVDGFTFCPSWDLPLPATVEAEVEYLGGARKGLFHLTDVQPCP